MKRVVIGIVVTIIVIIAVILIKIDRKTIVSYQNQAINPEIKLASENANYSTESVWCGSFQLVWNELKDYYGRKIEFEESNNLIDKLNTNLFSKADISSKDYYIKVIDLLENKNAKVEIKDDLQNKFNIDNSQLIDNIDLNANNGILLYSMINKKFEYIHPFDDVGTMAFIDKETKEASSVKYFGTNKNSKENIYENVTVVFYENSYNLVLRLNTKNDEIIYLYKNDFDESYSLDELYDEMNKKIEGYDGSIQIKQGDIIKIPNIDINYTINYDELCGKEIVGLNGKYISNAIQTINMALDSKGGQIKSEAAVITDSMASYPIDGGGYYIFDSPFVIFIKEKGSDNPYFMAKIVNPTFLVEN